MKDEDIADYKYSPWKPMQDPVDLKHLGKLAEELGELSAAVARCIIQGIDECEPETLKPNRSWLEEEIADVVVNMELVSRYFALDMGRMERRAELKLPKLTAWHREAGK